MDALGVPLFQETTKLRKWKKHHFVLQVDGWIWSSSKFERTRPTLSHFQTLWNLKDGHVQDIQRLNIEHHVTTRFSLSDGGVPLKPSQTRWFRC